MAKKKKIKQQILPQKLNCICLKCKKQNQQVRVIKTKFNNELMKQQHLFKCECGKKQNKFTFSPLKKD